MISYKRLLAIVSTKSHEDAQRAMELDGNGSECWGIYDNVLVIYDENDPPTWLAQMFKDADENGQTPEFRELHPEEVIA